MATTAKVVYDMMLDRLQTSFGFEMVFKARYKANFISDEISIEIKGIKGGKEVTEPTKATKLSEQTQFTDIFINSLKRKLRAKEFTLVYASFDFVSDTQEAECYYIHENGKKYKTTEKIEI